MRIFTRYLRTIVMVLIVSGLLVLPASASGPIIYEQSPGHFGGFLSDGPTFTVADEFQFVKPTLIYNVTWWGGYGTPGILPEKDSFKIWIFADTGGSPGALLAVYDVGNNAARTATGDWVNPPDPALDFPGRPEFQYYFELPSAFYAAGGTRYWISIVNAPSEDSWFWEVSASLEYLGVQRSFEYGPWAPYFDNTAFRLKGTQVP